MDGKSIRLMATKQQVSNLVQGASGKCFRYNDLISLRREAIMQQQSLPKIIIGSKLSESNKDKIDSEAVRLEGDIGLPVEKKIRIRAAANEWISENFPRHRKFLLHTNPEYSRSDKAWTTTISTRNLNGRSVAVGCLLIDNDARIVEAQNPTVVHEHLEKLLAYKEAPSTVDEKQIEHHYGFRLGDGIEGANLLPDKSIDLLLTDPPYGISQLYTCESQVPRRLRKDGTDFIMPRGNLGIGIILYPRVSGHKVSCPKCADGLLPFAPKHRLASIVKSSENTSL